MGWGQIVISHESKGGSNFISNSLNYFLAPVFEAGLFFDVLFFFVCEDFPLFFAEEPCTRASTLAAAFRGVVFGLNEVFVF